MLQIRQTPANVLHFDDTTTNITVQGSFILPVLAMVNGTVSVININITAGVAIKSIALFLKNSSAVLDVQSVRYLTVTV